MAPRIRPENGFGSTLLDFNTVKKMALTTTPMEKNINIAPTYP